MRQVEIQLFGAFRDVEPEGRIAIDVDGTHVADLRVALQAHAAQHWTAPAAALVPRSAFASETQVLRDADPLPADGRLALLPPVSGG